MCWLAYFHLIVSQGTNSDCSPSFVFCLLKRKSVTRKVTERNVSFALELGCALFVVLLKACWTWLICSLLSKLFSGDNREDEPQTWILFRRQFGGGCGDSTEKFLLACCHDTEAWQDYWLPSDLSDLRKWIMKQIYSLTPCNWARTVNCSHS